MHTLLESTAESYCSLCGIQCSQAEKADKAVKMIQSDLSFDRRNIILKLSVSLLKILHMADSNGPNMEKLWYMVLKTEENIHKCIPVLNDDRYFPTDAPGDSDTETNDDEDRRNEEKDEEEEDAPPEYCTDDESVDPHDEEVPGNPFGCTDETSSIEQDSFGGQVLAVWLHYKPLFEHDYARAGYMLSVNPRVYSHAKVTQSFLFSHLLQVSK